MSNVLVKIIAVQHDTQIQKRDGGTYTGTQVTYDSNGRVMSKAFSQAFLSKVPQLAAKVKALQPNQEVTLVLQKNGQFTNVTDILDASEASKVSEPPRGGNNYRSKPNTTNTKDVARIARQTAVQAAATFAAGTSTDTATLLANADEIAAFILAPLGLDSAGDTQKVEAPKADFAEEDPDEDLPF